MLPLPASSSVVDQSLVTKGIGGVDVAIHSVQGGRTSELASSPYSNAMEKTWLDGSLLRVIRERGR
jgi:hypothetical protein